MKKLFENRTTYTKESYIEFLTFHNKRYNVFYYAYTLLWVFLFILCIIISFNSGLRIQGILITILLVSFISYRILRPKMVVDKELASDKLGSDNKVKFVFYDKNFEVTNQKGTFSHKYFNLRKVFETNDYFYLYISKENAFLLSKKTFSLGTSEEFSSFIKNKCAFKYKSYAK